MNPFAKNLTGLMLHADKFIRQLESGEGLDLSEEKKKEFMEQMETSGAKAKIGELKSHMQNLRDKIKTAATNGPVNNPQQ
jgi:hypothetical protein